MTDQSAPTSGMLLERGMELHRAGRLKEAAAVYRAVLAGSRDTANARHLLAVLCLDTGELDEARALLAEVVRERPDSAKSVFAAHIVRQRLGLDGFAEALLERYEELANRKERKDVVVFGDSHSEFCFSGIARCRPILVGFHTMHRIGRDGLGVLDLRDHDTRDGDTAVFVFGEIDVRLHIGRQRDERGRDPDAVIEDLATRYFRTIAENARNCPGVRVIVSSVVPPSERTPYEAQPKHGTLSDRVRFARRLNARLRALCGDHGFGHLDLFTPFALEDGSMNPAFCHDTVHVGKEFHGIVALALRCAMLDRGWDGEERRGRGGEASA